ncbi:E3 UFM1-protein ligase 1 [Nymphon striatum]|nr:E3 UFM1-protein ligase 1 [Nymphon striatum]
MATDWDEIKKLAADFQRAQLSTSAQKLSEKNCVEVIQKLIELQLLDVIFTSDGKEYLTPQHLGNEILDELFVHGGRIDLTELVQILNVDYNHIELKVSDLTSTNNQIHLVLGQVISNDYLDHVAEEINEKLQQEGQISIDSLTKVYNLPGDFLQQVVDDRYGSIIQAQYDPFDHRMLFTPSFVARHQAQICGALTALTRPTPVASILSQYSLQERLFYSIVDDLTKSGRLAGYVQGAKQEKATYIPDIYSKSQNDYVESFYKQNQYLGMTTGRIVSDLFLVIFSILEYDSLVRLGISDPRSYIKKVFKQEQLFYLQTCCLGKQLLEQMDGAIEDTMSTGSWLDVMPLLPSIVSGSDANILLQAVLKEKLKVNKNSHIFCDSIIVSNQLINDCLKTFDPLMTAKATEDMKQGIHLKLQQQAAGLLTSSKLMDDEKKDKKEDRRKRAAGGKAGGGAQGRETRTKSVKKKYRANKGGDDSDSDFESQSGNSSKSRPITLQFLDCDQIEIELSKLELLEECPPELIKELSENMQRPLEKLYEKLAKTVFESSSISNVSRKKAHDNLQEKVSGLFSHIKLFEKGISAFSDETTQAALMKHLLKTTSSDLLNHVLAYLATDHIPDQDITFGTSLSIEMRQKLINKLPNKLKDPIQKIHTSLNSKDSLLDFYDAVEVIFQPEFCDIIIRKMDKKKERQIIFNHRQALLTQISEIQGDFAVLLHLAVLILHQTVSGCMLQASGKFVPQIIAYLQTAVSAEQSEILQTYQGLVIQSLKSKEEEQINECKQNLERLSDKIKELAISFKKTVQSN